MATVKYTQEIVDKMTQLYQASPDPDLEEIADEIGISKRSLIAKLCSLGIYSKKPYTNKNGQLPVKKSEYLEKLSDLLGESLETLESLEKANKNVLKLLVEALSDE